MIRTVIVDDDSLVHATLRSLLDWESCGFTIVADLSGGSQALDYLQSHPVDLLITDIKMPETSGLELMRRLRQSASLPVTVVLSGYDEFELVREAFRLGAYDYLLKASINRAALAQLLEGLREKVFPRLAGSENPALPEEAPWEPEPGDYVAAVFVVQHFSQAARRFGGNLRAGMERPMLELTRQIRRLQGRARLRAREPACYELYYYVQGKDSIRTVAPSMVRQIQEVWRDYMNLDTTAGISGVVPREELPRALKQCDTLCKLAVLRGPGGVCSQWQDGALALTYEE